MRLRGKRRHVPFPVILDPVLAPDHGCRQSTHAVHVGPSVSPPTGTQESCHCEIAGTHSDGNNLIPRLLISIIHRDHESGVTTVPVKVSLPSIGRSFKTLMLVPTGIILSDKQSHSSMIYSLLQNMMRGLPFLLGTFAVPMQCYLPLVLRWHQPLHGVW
jgi:hypothetical protein